LPNLLGSSKDNNDAINGNAKGDDDDGDDPCANELILLRQK